MTKFLDPTEDRLVVRPDIPKEQTVGGIIIPQMAQEKPTQGTVITVGPKVFGIATGDLVLYSRFGGQDVTIEGEDLLILAARDVLGVLREDPAEFE